MSIRDEIDRVIEEEAKKDNRIVRRQEVLSKRKARERARLPPTYFAVLIGKLLYKLHRKPSAPRRPVTPKRGIEGYVELPFIEEPKVTVLTIIKEDLRNLPRKLFHLGLRKKKAEPKKEIPNSNESLKDWEEFFDRGQV